MQTSQTPHQQSKLHGDVGVPVESLSTIQPTGSAVGHLNSRQRSHNHTNLHLQTRGEATKINGPLKQHLPTS